jgi:hypothetical protein
MRRQLRGRVILARGLPLRLQPRFALLRRRLLAPTQNVLQNHNAVQTRMMDTYI